MKKRKLLFWMLISSVLIFSCAFIACSNNSEPKKLNTPEVYLTDDIANWEANSFADKFEISLNGELSYIENSITSKKLLNGQTFKIRAIGDGINYLNSDWSKLVTYIKPIERYTITWKNGDTILETDVDVLEGTTPTYDGSTPTKEADEQYSYTFTGWSPEIEIVSEDAVYTAVFSGVLNTYTVEWKNDQTIIETDTDVSYGTIPTYDGELPKKQKTQQYTYEFSGWSPIISAVTGNIVYQAQFNEILNKYTVNFYNEDGDVLLYSTQVYYGGTAIYSGNIPSKNATISSTFTFDKWLTEKGGQEEASLISITKDMNVYASFNENIRKVSVYVVAGNYGTVTENILNNIPFGTQIFIEGSTIVVGSISVNAIAFESNAQYTYSFVEWDAKTTVDSNTILTAIFVRTINNYRVEWKNGEDFLEIDEQVPYGDIPVYNGNTPQKDLDAQNSYAFSGWSPVVGVVTGNIVYQAQFSETTNKYVVTFYDDNGTTILGASPVDYGQDAVYVGSIPEKNSTEQYHFTFEKWVTVKNGTEEAILNGITENMSVYAKYKEELRSYVVTFKDYNGESFFTENFNYGSVIDIDFVPWREGYRFVRWKNMPDSVRGDVFLTAEYEKVYSIKFLDFDGTVIDSKVVVEGEMVQIPEAPVRAGFRFNGWNQDIKNIEIHQDYIITAQYKKQYSVKFLLPNGSLIEEKFVDEENSAIPPKAPDIEGFEFIDWDKEFLIIKNDMEITAVYSIKTYKVRFLMPDGTIICEDEIEHGFSAVAPEDPEYYLSWNYDSSRVYGFTRWDKEFNKITADLDVIAICDSPYLNPVVLLDIDDSNNEATLYIIKDETLGDMKLYGMELVIEYSVADAENKGNITIKSAELDSSGKFYINETYESYSGVINDNSKTYTLTWSNGNGVDYNCTKELTIKFNTNDSAKLSDWLKINGTISAIIGESNADNLNRIIPTIIYI